MQWRAGSRSAESTSAPRKAERRGSDQCYEQGAVIWIPLFQGRLFRRTQPDVRHLEFKPPETRYTLDVLKHIVKDLHER